MILDRKPYSKQIQKNDCDFVSQGFFPKGNTTIYDLLFISHSEIAIMKLLLQFLSKVIAKHILHNVQILLRLIPFQK